MAKVTLESRGLRSRGFTLVELLVVIAIIGILASLLTPVLMKARQEGFKVDCKNNLGQIHKSCLLYSTDPRWNGRYPWPRAMGGGSGPTELSEDSDARASLELLYKHNFLEDPRVFLCKAATTSAGDEEAETFDTPQERLASFRLEDHNCSYTYRKRLTGINDDAKTPLTGDKRGGEEGVTNHKDGRHVVFLGGNVVWFPQEQLEEAGNKQTKKAKAELIGFDRIGRSN